MRDFSRFLDVAAQFYIGKIGHYQRENRHYRREKNGQNSGCLIARQIEISRADQRRAEKCKNHSQQREQFRN